MAKIPIEEKKGSSTWWMWLIGLLVLVGIIWLFIAASDAEPDADDLGAAAPVTEEVESDVEAVAAAGAIGTLAVILDEPNVETLVGRGVVLEEVYVTSVVGDSAFYVAAAADGPEGRQFLVALDEVIPAPPPDVEGRYDVAPGQVVALRGTIQEITSEDLSAWGMTDQEAQPAMDDQIYLSVQELEILDESAGGEAV